MVVKFRIENEADIPTGFKDEYESRDGAWYLKVEGTDDAKALKDALAKERSETKKAKDALAVIAAKEEESRLAALRASGDLEALEASWREKHEKVTKELRDKVEAKERTTKQAAKLSAATALAAKISTAPALMQRYILDRLSVELVDDEPLIRVVDERGKPSAASITDLEKELLANKEFAAIIRASDASGGGAGSGSGGGSGGGGAAPKRLFDMTGTEKRAFYERDPEGYRAQAAKEQAEDTTST